MNKRDLKELKSKLIVLSQDIRGSKYKKHKHFMVSGVRIKNTEKISQWADGMSRTELDIKFSRISL